MKITRKVLIALLSLALIASCFAITAAAAATDPVTDENVEEVLGYFGEVYVNEDFEASSATNQSSTALMKVFKNAYSDAFLAKYSKSQSKSVNAKNGVLTLKVPTLDMVVYFQVETAASTSFGINATVSSATADGSVNVAVYDAEGNATTLFSIVDGKVTANGAEPVTNSAVATDTEYSLMAHYLVNDDGSATATLVINGDTANKYTVQLANAAYSRFDLNFKAEAKNTKNVFTISDLEMYEGDIAHKLEGTANEIAAYINAIAAAIDTASDPLKYANVIYGIVSTHGYDVNEITDATLKATTEASIAKAKSTIGTEYISKFVGGVNAINTELIYPERLAYYKTLAEYYSLVEIVLPEQTDEKKAEVAAAKVLFDAEGAALDKIATETKASVDTVLNLNEKEVNYATLKETLAGLETQPIDPNYSDEVYTAEKIAEAFAKINTIGEEIAARDAALKAFEDAIKAATAPDGEETAEQFTARYEAYVFAAENKFDDTSYNAYAPEGIENYVDNVLAAYAIVEAEMNAEKAAAIELADKVAFASVLGYLEVSDYLEFIADEVAAANLGYPGVTATVEYYGTLCEAAAAITGNDILAELLEYFTTDAEMVNGDTSTTFTFAELESFGFKVSLEDATLSVFKITVGDVTVVELNGGTLSVNGVAVADEVTAIELRVYFDKTSNGYKAYVENGEDVISVDLTANTSATVVADNTNAPYVMYNGSFVRDAVSYDEVATYINTLVALYDAEGNSTPENLESWIKGIYETIILECGFELDGITDAALKTATETSITRAAEILGNDYAEKLIAAAGKIDVNAAYNNRLAYVAKLKALVEFVEDIETKYVYTEKFVLAVDAEALEAAKTAYEAESDELVRIATETKAAVDAVIAIGENVNASTYKALYDAVQIFKANAIDVTFYDDTYIAEMVENAYDAVKTITKRFNLLDSMAKAFVENVPAAKADSENTFSVRYAAYVIAKENYFNDVTYNEFLTDITIESLVEAFAIIDAEMVIEGDKARDVIGAIVATAPLNYFAKASKIDELAAIVATANKEYPGVAEAIKAYEAIVEFVKAESIERLTVELTELYEGKTYLNTDFTTENDESWVRGIPASLLATEEFAFTKNSSFAYKTTDGIVTFRTLGYANFDFVPENAGSFGINLKAKLSSETDSISLALYNASRDTFNVVGKDMIVIENGSVTVYGENESVVYTSAVEYNEMLNISIYYEATANGGQLSVTIELDDGTTEVYFATVEAFAYRAINLAVSEVAIDSINVYAGSFNRSAANVAELTANYINKIVEKANGSVALLEDVARIIVNNDLAIDTITDAELKEDVVASINSALTLVGNDYAAKVVAGAAAVDTTAAYNARLDSYNALQALDTILTAIQTDFADIEIETAKADIDAARVALAQEKAALDKAMADTKTSYAAAIAVPELFRATYKDLRDAYDTFVANPVDATFYDDELTAEEMAAGLALIDEITALYNTVNTQVEAFYANVKIADNTNVSADETADAFAARYAAYLTAKTNFFSDNTYDEYRPDGAKTVAETVALYNSIDTEMVAVAEHAENFITTVKEANLTLSYSVKKLTLATAATLLENVEFGYPGVTDAEALYKALLDNVTAKEASTKAYIEAVVAIASATDLAGKKAAIEAAKSLAAAGNDVSVDVTVNGVGVTQANILLSNAESAIVLAETRVKNFVNAVAAINSATTMEAKRDAIANALAKKDRADATDSDVVTAAAALDKAISDYNAAVAAANSAMKSATEVASTVMTKTVPTKPAAQIVAIIKKIFD